MFDISQHFEEFAATYDIVPTKSLQSKLEGVMMIEFA